MLFMGEKAAAKLPRLPYVALDHTIIKFIVNNCGCGANVNVLSLMASYTVIDVIT